MDLEILDLFPQDHPLLNEDEDYSEMARSMSQTLNDIVNNDYDLNDPEKILGFIFVFDARSKLSFDTLSVLVETIKELEKSKAKGKKKDLVFETKKIVIGNKKDLKVKKSILEKSDFKKLDGMRFREVSALTNQGI